MVKRVQLCLLKSAKSFHLCFGRVAAVGHIHLPRATGNQGFVPSCCKYKCTNRCMKKTINVKYWQLHWLLYFWTEFWVWFLCLQLVCFPAGRFGGAEAAAVGCPLLCVPRLHQAHWDFWCSVSQTCSNLYKMIKTWELRDLLVCNLA